MPNEVSKPKTLQERVTSRLQESIGDIITDEDLKPIVERGIHDVFFEEKEVRNSWGSITETRPALIHKVVKDLLAERVRQATEQYITDHEEEVLQVIQKAVRDKASTLLLEALSEIFTAPLQNFHSILSDRVSKVAQEMRQRFPDSEAY